MKNKLLSFILAICMLLPCSLALTACGSKPDDPAHTHNWSTTYSKDSAYHWLTCDGCEETKDKGIHTFVSKTCSVCGYVQGTDPNPSVPTVTSVKDLEIITTVAGIGSATLVKLPDGKDMLIDAGDGSADSVFYLHGLIDEYVSDLTIEYFVLTNTEIWRSGGAPDILYNYTVLNFYRPDVKSSHTIAAGLSSEYNSGNSSYVDDTECYALALEAASLSDGCSVKVVDETSCDIDYTFEDNSGNNHNYKIDFMTPIVASSRDSLFDNSVMISIEYKGVTTLITGDTGNDLIDAYCNVYGTKYDVDVLITSYHHADESKYAISRSDSRETYFLEKISLVEGDYSILLSSTTTEIGELVSELNGIGAGYYTTLDYYTITAKVTTTGVLDVTAE